MSSNEICYWVKTYIHTPTPTPTPPNKKLIGFGSFEKVNSKLAGGVRTPGPPGQLRPCWELIWSEKDMSDVRVKDEAKIASRGTDWDDIITER